ncbi:MAG TPA: hypothetical protein VE967_13530, partial [Gemmatimonadaceae bacterium]|nr:hypothetical protein [Gemmatimonadaceae bacterium]
MLWLLLASSMVPQVSAGAQSAAAPPRAPAQISEAAYVDSLEAAELRFFYDWRQVWGLSELGRHMVVGQLSNPGPDPNGRWRRQGNDAVTALRRPPSAPPGATPATLTRETYERVREENTYCEPGDRALWAKRHFVESLSRQHGACPTWLLGTLETGDERTDIDGGLSLEYKQAVSVARRSLADAFIQASARFPHNDWIAGQAVRLLVDARNLDAAARTAAACAATRWWCDALQGYVHHARNETVAAERAFRSSLEHMPGGTRCRWNDAGMLLDSLARAAYARVPCEQRDSLNERLWWLADPMYSEPGNARLAEHYARQVLVALHSALDRDERYDWRSALAGDALAQMIVRYGWPSYTWWGGPVDERAHNHYVADDGGAFKMTYTTFEYSAGRAKLLPSWNAVQDPLHATAGDWTLRDPAPPANPNASAWWPQEHIALPIAQLPEPQVAMLRRQAGVIVAAAMDVDTAQIAGTLLMTDRPDSIDVVARGGAAQRATLVLRGVVQPRQALLALELAGDSAHGVAPARTRFSVSPPA